MGRAPRNKKPAATNEDKASKSKKKEQIAPSTEPSEPADRPKRARGRPAKLKENVSVDDGEFLEQSSDDAPAEMPKPPPKRQRSRKHPAVAAAPAEGDDFVEDESGNKIPIPPKHGAPISHTRPRRSSAGAAPEALMQVNILSRKLEGDDQEGLPTATVHVTPSTTLNGLRKRIYELCPVLPPQAQHFFRKVEGEDHFQRLDSTSRYNKTLRNVGYDLPGPHEIWVEIDLAELLKELPDVTGAGVPQLQGQLGGPELLTQMPLSPDQQQLVVAQQPENADEPREDVGEDKDEDYDPEAAEMEGMPISAPQHHRNANLSKNRANKRWTDQEVEQLLVGLMKYGTSSWTTIAKTWKFPDRTTVDLKDKWRNLVKNVRDGRTPRGTNFKEHWHPRIWKIIQENGYDVNPQHQLVEVAVQEDMTPTEADQSKEDDIALEAVPAADQVPEVPEVEA